MMCLLRIVIAYALMVVSVSAQSLPALYDVTGVASNDVLNVRDAPSGQGTILGALAYNQTNVEVVERSANGNWGRVNINEGSGWVSLNYMQAQGGTSYALTRVLSCSGTEPFWSLSVTQGQTAQLRTPDGAPVTYNVGLLNGVWGRPDRWVLSGTAGGNMSLTAVARRQSCSDGMSDRHFGIDFDVVLRGANSIDAYSGCCSLVAN